MAQPPSEFQPGNREGPIPSCRGAGCPGFLLGPSSGERPQKRDERVEKSGMASLAIKLPENSAALHFIRRRGYLSSFVGPGATPKPRL
jgi:hypothetical protein